MKTFLAFLLGAVLAGGIVWYLGGEKHGSTPPPSSTSTPHSTVEKKVDDIKKGVSDTADSVRSAIDAKLDLLHLKADQIKEELAAKGKVVRNQSREWATEVKDAALDAKITGEIKGKYALDKEVSALNVSVNTTDGVVTLSGSASSYDAISKAILLAMETEGVRQVISTIQVK